MYHTLMLVLLLMHEQVQVPYISVRSTTKQKHSVSALAFRGNSKLAKKEGLLFKNSHCCCCCYISQCALKTIKIVQKRAVELISEKPKINVFLFQKMTNVTNLPLR